MNKILRDSETQLKSTIAHRNLQSSWVFSIHVAELWIVYMCLREMEHEKKSIEQEFSLHFLAKFVARNIE